MQKSEAVLEILKKNFPTAKFREFAGIIRFSTDSIDDVQIIELGILSVERACDIKIKRSGTGLLIIINL